MHRAAHFCMLDDEYGAVGHRLTIVLKEVVATCRNNDPRTPM
jgi:hypothetical protein